MEIFAKILLYLEGISLMVILKTFFFIFFAWIIVDFLLRRNKQDDQKLEMIKRMMGDSYPGLDELPQDERELLEKTLLNTIENSKTHMIGESQIPKKAKPSAKRVSFGESVKKM